MGCKSGKESQIPDASIDEKRPFVDVSPKEMAFLVFKASSNFEGFAAFLDEVNWDDVHNDLGASLHSFANTLQATVGDPRTGPSFGTALAQRRATAGDSNRDALLHLQDVSNILLEVLRRPPGAFPGRLGQLLQSTSAEQGGDLNNVISIQVLPESVPKLGTKGATAKDPCGKMEMLFSRESMAALLVKNGYCALAETLLRSSLQRCEESMHCCNNGMPRFLVATSNLACVLQASEQYQEAESLIRAAIARSTNGGGSMDPCSPEVLSLTGSLAKILHATGKLTECENVARCLAERAESTFGSAHTITLKACESVASILRSAGRHAEAKSYMWRVLETRENNFGHANADTQESMRRTAAALHAEGKAAERELLLKHAVRNKDVPLGPSPIDLSRFKEGASMLMASMGKFAEAAALHRSHLVHPETPTGPVHATSLQSFAARQTNFRFPTEVPVGFLKPLDPASINSLATLSVAIDQETGEVEARLRDLIVNGTSASYRYLVRSDNLQATHELACFLYLRKNFDQAEDLLSQSYDIKDSLFGSRHPDTVTAVNNLALLKIAMGKKTNAEVLLRNALKIRQRELGDAHVDTLSSLQSLALLTGILGKHEESEQLYTQIWHLRRLASGCAHPQTLVAAHNLAALQNAMGKPFEAETTLTAALEACEAKFGLTHVCTLRALELQAALMDARGRHEEARQLLQRVVDGRETLFGPSHPDSLLAADNLGLVLGRMGRQQDAVPLSLRTLECRQASLGLDHLETLSSLYRHSMLLKSLGRHHEAALLLPRVSQGFQAALGPIHADVIMSLHAQALLWQAMGLYSQADPCMAKVVSGCVKLLGDDNEDTLRVKKHHAELLLSVGGLDVSDEFAQLLKKRVAFSSETALNTLGAAQDVANVMSRLGKFSEAELFCRRAFDGRVAVLGIEHDDTIASACALASLLVETGKNQEAEQLFLIALAGSGDSSWGNECPALLTALGQLSVPELTQLLLDASRQIRSGGRKVLWPDCEVDTPTFNTALGSIFEAAGVFHEAEPLLRCVVEDLEGMLGPMHYKTLQSATRLARLLARTGAHVEAEALYRRVYEGLERLRDCDHLDVLAAAVDLGSVLQSQSGSATMFEAETILRRTLSRCESTVGNTHECTLKAISALGEVLQKNRQDADAKREAERLLRRAVEGYQFTKGLHNPRSVRAMKLLAQLLKDQGKHQEAWHLYRMAVSGRAIAPAATAIPGDDMPADHSGCWFVSPALRCCSRAVPDGESTKRCPNLSKDTRVCML